MTALPKIGVVVLNYNGKKDTIDCLQSLFAINISDFIIQIILIDNNSTDDSMPAFKKFISQNKKIMLKIIENKTNLGFAEGNNVGIREALKEDMDYILILNNDTLADKNLVSNLLETAQKYPEVGIIGPKIYFAKGFEYHYDRYKEEERGRVIWYAGAVIDWENMLYFHRGVDEVDIGQFDKSKETDFVSGCAMFIRREVFDKVGIFNPDYFLYLEDVDLCQRARMVGFTLWYEAKAFLWHKNASASGKPGSSTHIYYQTRNRLLFGFKYASFRTKIALLKEGITMLLKDKIRKQAVLDFFLGRLGKGYL